VIGRPIEATELLRRDQRTQHVHVQVDETHCSVS
jgi:hypothetical protein